MRYLLGLTLLLFSAYAWAGELEDAVAICNRHCTTPTVGPIGGRNPVCEAGWEHCPRIFTLKKDTDGRALLNQQEKADHDKTLRLLGQ